MREKRLKKSVRPNIDYHHRWPTTQTLVESQNSLDTVTSRRGWKLNPRAEWLKLLEKTKGSPKPGKSTHPYDTGVDEWVSDSESASTTTATLVPDRGKRWYKPFRGNGRVPSPLPPVLESPPVRVSAETPRPETPKTPVQYLRLWTGPIMSIATPSPRTRTVSPIHDDHSNKSSVKPSKSAVQLPVTPRKVLCPFERARNHWLAGSGSFSSSRIDEGKKDNVETFTNSTTPVPSPAPEPMPRGMLYQSMRGWSRKQVKSECSSSPPRLEEGEKRPSVEPCPKSPTQLPPPPPSRGVLCPLERSRNRKRLNSKIS